MNYKDWLHTSKGICNAERTFTLSNVCVNIKILYPRTGFCNFCSINHLDMLERFLPDSNSKFDYASSFDVFCASSWSFMCVVVVRKLRPQYLAPIEVLSNDIIVGIC